ncbi:MAG: NAD(P)/FAD-dependent oxidoreductase [Verrucomicrobiae bacterium]|nr:NAD(P)/FAD-dependent oxidoreductase [Verrucomicrobiae bacterium]
MLKTTDICIVGGGPAGSVLAIKLAQHGWGVCLVERATFPRRHLGESLTPGVLALLESIGADRAIERAAFPRVHRVSVSWEEVRERDDPQGKGMLVDRGEFDRILLDQARNAGVMVLQPAMVKNLQSDGVGWKVTLEEVGRMTPVQVRFLADATGRAGVLPRRRRRTGPRTIALHGYWSGKGLPGNPRIEAGSREWYWGVPLPDGTYNTLVFLDPRDLRALPGSLEEKFLRLIASSSLLPPEAEAKLIDGVQAIDATPFLDEECVTANSIKVGDAAMALDPLSSSGVQKAIQSALAGAAVVNTLLKCPESGEIAKQFYHRSLDDASNSHRTWARGHYGKVAMKRPTSFWQERAGKNEARPETIDHLSAEMSPEIPVKLAPQVSIVPTPCLVDDFITSRPAVTSPNLDAPVAFLGGVELAPLVCQVRPGMTQAELVRHWMPEVPPSKGWAIARWLIARGMLISCENAVSPAVERRAT